MRVVLNVRKRQWAYILFLEQVLLELFHVPPSLKQSCSVFAAFTFPAKAGPVKASARVTAKIEIKVFMAVSPFTESGGNHSIDSKLTVEAVMMPTGSDTHDFS